MDRRVSVRRRRFNKPWTERCKDYLRNFLAFMFSNVGIIGLVVGYIVAGTFIFIEIEGKPDPSLKKYVSEERNRSADNIWKIMVQNNTFDEGVWKARVTDELKQYQTFIARAVKNGMYQSDSMDAQLWSFSSAFLYCLSVITTTGYGHVVPRTELGKITTIIYAIVGMPLFLLYLSNIGDIMARSFKWLYAKLCLCRCCPGVTRRRQERFQRRAAELNVRYLANREGSGTPEVCIEQGGIAEMALSIKEEDEDDDDDDDDDDDASEDDIQNVTVPLMVCFGIMVGYILGGTFLFSKYEDDWNKLEGSYFCFISLSTIGFGDFVPGDTIQAKSLQVSSILGSIYLLVGMALIAMCFNLMQEEVVHKIRTTMKTLKNIFRCSR